MNKTRLIVSTLLTLSMWGLSARPAQAQFVPQEPVNPPALKKSELPTGGNYVEDPRSKVVSYYFVNAGRLPQGVTLSGLYQSVDGGQVWRKVQSFFNFQNLFIHPDSGELFAIIQDNVMVPDDKGFLTISVKSKAIRSTDGTHWKDIMGKMQRASELHGISVDPDHPSRVRLSGWAFRGYYLIAEDDAYSDWNQVTIPYGPPF